MSSIEGTSLSWHGVSRATARSSGVDEGRPPKLPMSILPLSQRRATTAQLADEWH